MINKNLIEQNFSDCAPYYDRYSSIQNLCGLKLINKIEATGFSTILDIGCGTGNYTRLLKNKFPDARITALDISHNMIEIAKKKLDCRHIEFIVTDAEELDINDQFDLISSNVSFQWFKDLEETLLRYKKLLSQSGIILFSVFGPDTFVELNRTLKEMYDDTVSIASCDFIGRNVIDKILGGILNNVTVTEEILKEEVDSISSLLRKIKYTGK